MILLKRIFCLVALASFTPLANAQYNQLFIPDTLSGENIRLVAKDTLSQILTGQQTVTAGYNGKMGGPTIFVNKGQTVRMEVHNRLNDSTTVHWHGLHLPAVMDGGPHQVIPPGTVWRPFWEVKNVAGTFWYHPHLHKTTQEQVNMGLGGFLIVRDPVERALPIPRTYGVDDIPLILADRRFLPNNQIALNVSMGDSVFTNFTLRAQKQVPAQVVRFRILNANIERSYNLAFSDGRQFGVIASEAGILPSTVNLTNYILPPGQRIEILVNFTGQQGRSIDLMAMNNNTLGPDIPGSESPTDPRTPPFLRNFLGNRNFRVCNFVVGAQTANPITTIPTTLVGPITDFPDTNQVTRRQKVILGFQGSPCPPDNPNCFWVDSVNFKLDYINKEVKVNTTEIWTVENTTAIAHPFHIHDISFKILDVNGQPPALADQGWKDVFLVRANSRFRFVGRFEDYADSIHPFMYHCHILSHEDDGMMGQFLVKNTLTSAERRLLQPEVELGLFPNPASERIYFKVKAENGTGSAPWQPYYIRITDMVGRTMLMLPRPDVSDGIDVSFLKAGRYSVAVTDDVSKQTKHYPLIIRR